jgi:hypothetical protein
VTTALTAMNCTSVAILSAAGASAHFGVSRQEFVLNVTLLVFAISNTPLVLAPMSEVVSQSRAIRFDSCDVTRFIRGPGCNVMYSSMLMPSLAAI